MAKHKTPQTPPSSSELDAIVAQYTQMVDGTAVTLSRSELRQYTAHRRDTVTRDRRARRELAAEQRSDRQQLCVNKAIQRKLDRCERVLKMRWIRVQLEPENQKKTPAGARRIRPTAISKLPTYDGPIVDRNGRVGVFVSIAYDGSKSNKFGVVKRRIKYLLDPSHCEMNSKGLLSVLCNFGLISDEIAPGADAWELAQRESRTDAKINVNLIVQLPHDVSPDVRMKILRAISHELFGRHGLPFAAAVHTPDPDGDQRNYHAHICGGWRPMKRTGFLQWDIADDFRSDLDGNDYWRHARRMIAHITTSELAKIGIDREHTHWSNAERGLPHRPLRDLDKRKTRMARAGGFVADVEANRSIIAENNALVKALKAKKEMVRAQASKTALNAAEAIKNMQNALLVKKLQVSAHAAYKTIKISAVVSQSPFVIGSINLRTAFVPLALQQRILQQTEVDSGLGLDRVKPQAFRPAVSNLKRVYPVPLSGLAQTIAPVFPPKPIQRIRKSSWGAEAKNLNMGLEFNIRTVPALPGSQLTNIDPVPLPYVGTKKAKTYELAPAPLLINIATTEGVAPPIVFVRFDIKQVSSPIKITKLTAQRIVPPTIFPSSLQVRQVPQPDASNPQRRLRIVAVPPPPTSTGGRVLGSVPTPIKAPISPSLRPVPLPADAKKNAELEAILANGMALVQALTDRLEKSKQPAKIAPSAPVDTEDDGSAGSEVMLTDKSHSAKLLADRRLAEFLLQLPGKAVYVDRIDNDIVMPTLASVILFGLEEGALLKPVSQKALREQYEWQRSEEDKIYLLILRHASKKDIDDEDAVVECIPKPESDSAEPWRKTGLLHKIMRRVQHEMELETKAKSKKWNDARAANKTDQSALAAIALAQFKRWPINLSSEQIEAMKDGAERHRQQQMQAMAQLRGQGF